MQFRCGSFRNCHPELGDSRARDLTKVKAATRLRGTPAQHAVRWLSPTAVERFRVVGSSASYARFRMTSPGRFKLHHYPSLTQGSTKSRRGIVDFHVFRAAETADHTRLQVVPAGRVQAFFRRDERLLHRLPHDHARCQRVAADGRSFSRRNPAARMESRRQSAD